MPAVAGHFASRNSNRQISPRRSLRFDVPDSPCVNQHNVQVAPACTAGPARVAFLRVASGLPVLACAGVGFSLIAERPL